VQCLKTRLPRGEKPDVSHETSEKSRKNLFLSGKACYNNSNIPLLPKYSCGRQAGRGFFAY
jgi:hypothetical protein